HRRKVTNGGLSCASAHVATGGAGCRRNGWRCGHNLRLRPSRLPRAPCPEACHSSGGLLIGQRFRPTFSSSAAKRGSERSESYRGSLHNPSRPKSCWSSALPNRRNDSSLSPSAL